VARHIRLDLQSKLEEKSTNGFKTTLFEEFDGTICGTLKVNHHSVSIGNRTRAKQPYLVSISIQIYRFTGRALIRPCHGWLVVLS
jgi:hypothetical protein